MTERVISLDQTFPLFDDSTYPISWSGVSALANTVQVLIPHRFGAQLVRLTTLVHDNWAPEDDSAYDGENLLITPWKPSLGYSLSDVDVAGVLPRVNKLRGLLAGDLAKYRIQTNANRPTGHDSLFKIISPVQASDRTLWQFDWWKDLRFQVDFDSKVVRLPYHQFESRVNPDILTTKGTVHLEFYPLELGPLSSARCPEFEDVCVLLKEGVQIRVPMDTSKLGTLQGRYLRRVN